MAETATSDIDEVLKVISQEPVIKNLVTDSELMDVFDVESEGITYDKTTGGRYIERAGQFALPGSVGARDENDYIPVPENPEFLNSRMYLRKILGAIQMTGDTMRRVRGDEGAYLDYAVDALGMLVQRVKNSVDRQYIGWGGAVLARTAQTFQGGGSPYTFEVVDAFGVGGFENPWVNFIKKDGLVFSSNATGTGLRNAGTTQAAIVQNVDPATNTITITADAALAAAVQIGDYIAMGDRSGTSFPTGGTVNKEIDGLLAGVDDGGIVPTYNNIARANQRDWQGTIIDGGDPEWGGACTEDLLIYADDETSVVGGGRVNLIVMPRSAARAYRKAVKDDQVVLDKRAYIGSKDYAPGKGVPIWLGDRFAEMRVSRKVPPQVVFGLETDSWRRITLNQWEWDDKSGSIWKQVGDSVGYKDAFWAYGHLYEQLYCFAPAHNFRIDNLVNTL